MVKLSATVQQALLLSDTGIVQYMTVTSPNAGTLTVLPPVNYLGVYAQMQAQKDAPVSIDHIRIGTGGVKASRFGLLLNQQGVQYGAPMIYTDRLSDFLFIGDHKDFPRADKIIVNANDARKSYMTIDMFGQKLNVRYAKLNANANKAELQAFQGYIFKLPNMEYAIWFPLSWEQMKRAAGSADYLGIKGIAHRPISFVQQNERANIADAERYVVKSAQPLEGRIVVEAPRIPEGPKPQPKPAQAAPALPPPMAQPKPLPARLIISDGGTDIPYEIAAGEYVVGALFDRNARATMPRGPSRVAESLDGHLTSNNPVRIGDAEFSKNARFSFAAGESYRVSRVETIVEAPAEQPRIAPQRAVPEPARPQAAAHSHRKQAPPPRVETSEGRQEYKQQARRSASGG
jgi:hypothetical protein